MMKRILLFLLLICSTAYAKAPLQPLTVMLDWFPNPDHAPLFVAQQQGFFTQQGLDVKLIGPANPDDPPKLVAAGKVDVAVMYPSQLLIDVDQGLPLVQFGTLIATPLSCIAVLQSSSIHSIADLKGKKIAYSSAASDLPTLSMILKQGGLTLKDVTLINVNYDLTQALLSHRVDAATGMMRNFELNQMALAGQPARAFYPEEEGVPNYSALVLVTNRKEIEDPRLQKFMIALQEGVTYLVNHPNHSWEMFAKAHPELNNPLNKMAWDQTLSRFALRPAISDPEEDQRYAEFLQKEGIIKKVPQNYVQMIPHTPKGD